MRRETELALTLATLVSTTGCTRDEKQAATYLAIFVGSGVLMWAARRRLNRGEPPPPPTPDNRKVIPAIKNRLGRIFRSVSPNLPPKKARSVGRTTDMSYDPNEKPPQIGRRKLLDAYRKALENQNNNPDQNNSN